MLLRRGRYLVLIGCLMALLMPAHGAGASPRLRAVVAVTTNYSGSFQPAPGLVGAVATMDKAIRGFAKRAGFAEDAVHIDFLADAPVPGYQTRMSSDGAIVTALASAARQSASGDTLIFYFTGHGTTEVDGKMMLHTTAANGIDPANRIDLDAQVLKVIQRNSKATRNLVFVDSCQSTGMAGALSMDKPLLKERSQIEGLKTPGVFTLLASDVNQLAHVDDRLGFGFFTGALANRLVDDAIGTASELTDAVTADVHKIVLERKKLTQTPVPSFHSSAGAYPLFQRRAAAIVAASSEPKSAPRASFSRHADFSMSRCLADEGRRDFAVFADEIISSPKEALPKGSFYQLRTGFTSPAAVKVFVGGPPNRTEIPPSTLPCSGCPRDESYFDVPVSEEGVVKYVMQIENGHGRTSDVEMNFLAPFALDGVTAAMTLPSGVEVDSHYSPGVFDHECLPSSKGVLQCYGDVGGVAWKWHWSLWNECTTGEMWPPERSIPGDTAWIFIGYLNDKSGAYSEGPYAKVVGGDGGSPRFSVGARIRLLADRPTIILDFKTSSTEKKLISPLRAGIIREKDMVGLVLRKGANLTIRDVVRGGAAGRDQAVWARVIRTPG